MTDHTHYEPKPPPQDQTVDRLAFQYNSSPVELWLTKLLNEHSPCSNEELFSPELMASCSGYLQKQDIAAQESIEFPLHDGQDMGIARYGGVGRNQFLPL